MKAIDLMKDLGEGFGEEEMSPEWPRCAESSHLDGYTLTKQHGQAVWAGAHALEAVLNSETRVVRVPLAVKQKAPPYSCGPCERGDHGNCPGRVYDISWQFDCACRTLVQHFEEVECYLVPVAAITTALGIDRATAMSTTEET